MNGELSQDPCERHPAGTFLFAWLKTGLSFLWIRRKPGFPQMAPLKRKRRSGRGLADRVKFFKGAFFLLATTDFMNPHLKIRRRDGITTPFSVLRGAPKCLVFSKCGENGPVRS